nr:hypothetical protein [Tanacetum cinerariifolium]
MTVEMLKEEANRRYQDSPLMMVVKEIISKLLEEEEKLEWWFEQDIDKEEERFKGDEDGGELEDVGRRFKIQKKSSEKAELSVIATIGKAHLDDKLTKEEIMDL